VIVKVEPLTAVSYRKPGPFGVVERGPLSTSSTYYQKITTLLGAIAYVAYANGLCRPSASNDPLGALRKCLSGVLELRGPYVMTGGGDCARIFFGEEELFDLSSLLCSWSSIKGVLRDLSEEKIVLKRKAKGLVPGSPGPAKKTATFGNSLNRVYKRSEAVFVRERVNLRGYHFFETSSSRNALPPSYVVPLGGDGGVGRVGMENQSPVEDALKKLWGNSWTSGSGAEAVLVVVSPVILEKSKNAPLSSPDDALAPFGHVLKNPEPVQLFSRFSVKPYPMGWDLSKNDGKGVPRPWEAAVVPGSAVKGVLKKAPKDVYWEGLGRYRDLGFGTVVPLPL